MKIDVPDSLEGILNRVVTSFGIEPDVVVDLGDVLEFITNCSNDDLRVIQDSINARKILQNSEIE